MCKFYRLISTLLVVVVIAPRHQCSPFFFQYNRPYLSQPSTSQLASTAANVAQRSNVTVALGNRINTDTALDDYGTRVDGVTINVDRRRKRRDIWGLSSILGPNAPNGSYIAINNQVFPLPESLSNVSLNIAPVPSSGHIVNISQFTSDSFMPAISDNYTTAFQSLMNDFQTLPLDTMDSIVKLLATGYQNTFGQLFLEESFQRLNQTLDYGREVVRNGLSNLADQAGQGFERIITRFNSSTGAVRQCVGDNLNPTNVARSVVDRGYNCINRKWQQLTELAGNIGEDIVAADKGAAEFLANLTTCNGAANFSSSVSTSERNTLRRQCYVRVITSFPQPLLFLPVSLAIDGAKLYASVSGLEVDIGACAAEVALAIGMTTAQIGTKVALCQVFGS
ncbi:uncharacterized protein LOC11175920 [Anopheles gambiae]|uniref:uncharacterized protein LOC11175920 n=1 Tax=Anopheles gambiae TaxID=7165 RepID=UPI002AC8BBD8|nr:uncharacterized protein LOC11175920 [Anopheles gambiae]